MIRPQIPKKQHYVPCAYLARFSASPLKDRRKSKILRTDLNIQNQPVTCETQCYREFFYSKNDAIRIEAELKELEDDFNRIVDASLSGSIERRDYKLLIFHHAILLGRTIAVQSMKEQDGYEKFNQATLKLLEHYYYDEPIDDLRSKKFVKYLSDNYESFIVKAEVEKLVTSDAPTQVFTNEDSSAAVLSLLPIASDRLSVVYKKGAIQVKPKRLDQSDVMHLNTLQAINSVSAVFSYDEFENDSLLYVRKALAKEKVSRVKIFDDRHEYNLPKVQTLEGKLRLLKRTAPAPSNNKTTQ